MYNIIIVVFTFNSGVNFKLSFKQKFWIKQLALKNVHKKTLIKIEYKKVNYRGYTKSSHINKAVSNKFIFDRNMTVGQQARLSCNYTIILFNTAAILSEAAV